MNIDFGFNPAAENFRVQGLQVAANRDFEYFVQKVALAWELYRNKVSSQDFLQALAEDRPELIQGALRDAGIKTTQDSLAVSLVANLYELYHSQAKLPSSTQC